MNKSIQEPKSNSVSILLLWLLFIPFTLSAQKNDKYIMLKPLSWDELQLYQLDNLKTSEELKLAQTCPSTLSKIQKELTKKRTVWHYIYGNLYIWTEYSNQFGNTCVVKHKKVDSIIKKENKKINPNEYEILSLTQARVLLSSSRGGGNPNKELARKQRIAEANRINQSIQSVPYEKYGGIENLFNYMAKNKPNCITQKVNLIPRTYVTEYGSHTGKLNSPIEHFENKYCESQINELIESVKKTKANNQ